jgi:succinate dehydrogenase / fumarate reductase flavoprotein subunit
MAEYVKKGPRPPVPRDAGNTFSREIKRLLESTGEEQSSRIRAQLQGVMTEKCSVFRDRQGLEQALTEILQLKRRYKHISLENKEKAVNYELEETFELGNMIKTAEVIVGSALQREESRGAHFRRDFPERNDASWLRHTLVSQTPKGLQFTYKPVTITRFRPEARRY